MSWFFIALIPPFVYAIANHLDKYILSKYLRGGEAGALIIFCSLFAVLTLPLIYLIHPAVSQVSPLQAVLLLATGTLTMFAELLYYYALYKDEASYVVPFYQLIPIFAFITGFFMLGETVTAVQAVASFLVITGAVILSFDISGRKLRFKTSVVLLMVGASFCYGLVGGMFKFVALDEGFWPSIFWSFAGQVLLGVVLLIGVPRYRRQFFSLMSENSGPILVLVSLGEILFLVGEAATAFATLLAPVGLVYLVNAFQPVFVFILGVILTLSIPRLGRESLGRPQLLQKLLGIGLIVGGSLFIGS